MGSVLGVVADLVFIYIIILIVRLVLDYVQLFARSWQPRGVVLVLAEVVYSLTDPPLKVLRRLIPPLRIGGVAIDLSLLVLIVALQLTASVLRSLSQ